MNLTQEALDLANNFGFHVFPVSSPLAAGPAAGKRPMVKNWQTLATTNPETIAEWWGRWPTANIGVATGHNSGIFVIDVDLKTDGLASLEALQRTMEKWPETLVAQTGSGGYHYYYYKLPPNVSVRNSASKIGMGIDVRGDGGYVVAPPSLHVSGNRYQWISATTNQLRTIA